MGWYIFNIVIMIMIMIIIIILPLFVITTAIPIIVIFVIFIIITIIISPAGYRATPTAAASNLFFLQRQGIWSQSWNANRINLDPLVCGLFQPWILSLVPQPLMFLRVAEGGAWNSKRKEVVTWHALTTMSHVWDHCPKFPKFDIQTFKPNAQLIHVVTFITSLQDWGCLPLVCFLKSCTDDLRIATHCFVHWGWLAGRLPPPFKCDQSAQWTSRWS